MHSTLTTGCCCPLTTGCCCCRFCPVGPVTTPLTTTPLTTTHPQAVQRERPGQSLCGTMRPAVLLCVVVARPWNRQLPHVPGLCGQQVRLLTPLPSARVMRFVGCGVCVSTTCLHSKIHFQLLCVYVRKVCISNTYSHPPTSQFWCECAAEQCWMAVGHWLWSRPHV